MKLITMKEAADILSLSPKTLYQWKWQGKDFPFVKIGRALRVSEPDIMQFIQNKMGTESKRKNEAE